MLKPSDILSREVKKGLGYNKKEMDAFLKEISDSFESVTHENNELKEKISVLNEGLQYYKSIEKTLQKALVLAQKTADENHEESLKKAKEIEIEAKVKADAILNEAKKKVQETNEKAAHLVAKITDFRTQIRSLLEAQYEFIENEAYDTALSDFQKELPNTEETSPIEEPMGTFSESSEETIETEEVIETIEETHQPSPEVASSYEKSEALPNDLNSNEETKEGNEKHEDTVNEV